MSRKSEVYTPCIPISPSPVQVVCDARASELPRYGIKTGLTNYPASYAVGLLLARRLNQKYGLDESYTGDILLPGQGIVLITVLLSHSTCKIRDVIFLNVHTHRKQNAFKNDSTVILFSSMLI